MKSRSFKATFARGGTSNGLVVPRSELPEHVDEWQPILASAMGSPDAYLRQLNGIGSGVSSTSKVCVIDISDRSDADLSYTFIQDGIEKGDLDRSGNCGNMSSVVGPVALNEGLIKPWKIIEDHGDGTMAVVRIFNTNTNKIIHSTFKVEKENEAWLYDSEGDFSISGVPGSGSCITLSFLDPAGSKTGAALPTGNPVDLIEFADTEVAPVLASLVDIANPAVYVLAHDLGIDGDVRPDDLQAKKEIMAKLECVRQEGAKLMGLDPTVQGVPKIVIVSSPSKQAADQGAHIQARAISMQQAHKALPGTLALNLACACSLPGTLPAQAVLEDAPRDSVMIAHPGGLIQVGCTIENGEIKSALYHRTARILMRGEVFYEL